MFLYIMFNDTSIWFLQGECSIRSHSPISYIQQQRKERQEMSASYIKQQNTPAIRQFQGEVVVYIPLSELHPFPNQPIKVRKDRAMHEIVESVGHTAYLHRLLSAPGRTEGMR